MRTVDVRQGYDLWAPDYDALDNPLIAMTQRALAGWRPRGARVLEIGCGTGRNAPFFLERGFESYVGVDVSEGMLAEARRKVTDARARFVLESDTVADEFVTSSGTFDGVFISLVLEHVADVAPILASAARATAQGAWLRILELHPALRHGGTGAHFKQGDAEYELPSYAHDVAELATAMAGTWELASTTDWYADVTASAKLAKHRGKPVLLDVSAVRM